MFRLLHLFKASGRHHDIKHTDWAIDDKTGVEHPCQVCDLPDGRCAQLLGCGHRPKKVAGLLAIDVYSIGLYANVEMLKTALTHHKGKPASVLGKDQGFLKDFGSPLVEKELRFVIVFRSVTRAAFWSNFSSRLGAIVKSPVGVAFEEHFKNVDFRKGTEIRLAMCRNGSLRTVVNQVEQGAVTSPELCAAITDIYIGDDPPSATAKHDVLNTVADILNNSRYNPPSCSTG